MERAATTPVPLGLVGVLSPSRAPGRTLRKVRVEGSSSREHEVMKTEKMPPTQPIKVLIITAAEIFASSQNYSRVLSSQCLHSAKAAWTSALLPDWELFKGRNENFCFSVSL